MRRFPSLIPLVLFASLAAVAPAVPAQAASGPAASGAVASGLVASGPATSGPVTDTRDSVVITGDSYRMTIQKAGFRYSFARRDGTVIAPAHAESGLRVGDADAVTTKLAGRAGGTAVLDVTLETGAKVRVKVQPSARHVKITADRGADFRTGPVAPAYGLGDYGAHADGQPDQGTPCSGQVEARRTTELTGIVLDNLTNEGSCKRFISTFVVFPRQRFAEVLFDEGQKRVGLTTSENRLGSVEPAQGLYYFAAPDLKRVYADYRDVRHRHGYADVRPRPELFGLGWEAYGALAWNTYQSSVTETVKAFKEHGYPLRWGVVGSGFWPGPRGDASEGTTNSFGMWDSTHETGRDDGLPNPRYPDPDALKKLFAGNGMALLLGARNNFKVSPNANDGPFTAEALARGYFLPVKVTKSQFPQGETYVLDAANPKAVRWYVTQNRKWGVDGVKEDTMLYAPNLNRDGNWNALQQALHDDGDLVIVRNAAYSVPGDVVRINDTIYGRGEVFHEDPDRIPVNLLNIAATGPGNLSPDIVGGTPKASLTDPSYRRYFWRNAQFAALTPVMAFGKGPWELEDPALAASVQRMALWHDALHPYIYDAVLDGYESGFPYAMTPLPIAYPDADPGSAGHEWMFGESLLAAPLFGRDFDTAQTRDVYLPAGKWIDYETGAVYQGPRTLKDFAIGMDRLPVFVGGKGVLITRTGAEVYPIARGSSFDAQGTGIVNANTGWNPAKLVVTDTKTGRRVAFTVDAKTGAIRFPVTKGHQYVLSGGGTAAHPFPIETDVPGAPGELSHEGTTLSWSPVEGARGYVVTGGCTSTVAGSTTGATTLTVAPGVYRVAATNAAGTGPLSEPHTVPPPASSDPVVVTNEGGPATCSDTPPYRETGTWSSSSLKGFDGSGTRFSATTGSTATWTARLPSGSYEVAVWYPAHTASTKQATYQVAGQDTLVDQTSGGGEWHSLGTWPFDGLASVTLSVTAPGNHRADAVRFTPAPR
ncbi:TIM-barrel domain-containing protein [Nonomuraea fuscirosea]|uniref:golvesin C-terminal-like domain-containing protein n=1 Tax=Nonomuraea fuscirosea TaxID=1291556 RepID=UPI00343DEB97